MRIPTWRVALTGGAVTILAIAGIGFATAANGPSAIAAKPATAAQTTAPDASGRPDRPIAGERAERREGREGWRGARLLRLGRHLVHAEVTLTGRDGELIVLQLDHGTVAAIGGGSLTIAEAGGGTETVSIDDATIVYLGREDGNLGDVTTGVEVFVQSRIDGSTVLAKRILVIVAKT